MSTALGTAVLASVALNASYLLQHAGSRHAPRLRLRHPLRSVLGLLRSRWWLAGGLAGLLGWALYLVALAHAPLSLVQAFATGGLALTVPAAARAFGQRLDRTERSAVLVLAGSLALLGVGASAPVLHAVPVAALGVSLGLAASVAATLAIAPGARSALALGAAGGVLYGAGDAATKAAAVTVHAGGWSALLGPWPVVVLALTVAAFACFQSGLQAGPVVPVIALMTASTNATAILIGLIAFDEPLGSGAASATLHALAFAAAGIAGLKLSAAQTRFV